MRELTEDQLDILQAIENYIHKNCYSPSIRELCEITGKNSPATIHYYLKKLKKLGYINFNENQNRTIRVIRKVKENGN